MTSLASFPGPGITNRARVKRKGGKLAPPADRRTSAHTVDGTLESDLRQRPALHPEKHARRGLDDYFVRDFPSGAKR